MCLYLLEKFKLIKEAEDFMKIITCRFVLLVIMVLSIVGCGGGGGGGGDGGGGGVIAASTNTTVTVPTAVSTISISGISSPIVCGIDLRVTYPNGTTYVNGVTSGVAPTGTSLVPINIRSSDADITILGFNGFGSGEIAKISYGTVPDGSSLANFGVSVLKVFDCNGVQIQ